MLTVQRLTWCLYLSRDGSNSPSASFLSCEYASRVDDMVVRRQAWEDSKGRLPIRRELMKRRFHWYRTKEGKVWELCRFCFSTNQLAQGASLLQTHGNSKEFSGLAERVCLLHFVLWIFLRIQMKLESVFRSPSTQSSLLVPCKLLIFKTILFEALQ